MKTLICILVLMANISFAKDYQLGIILGEPTGLSGKIGLGNNRAVDGAFAYSLDSKYGFHLHADYLFENVNSFSVKSVGPFEFFYGVGGYLTSVEDGKDKDKTALGIRGPFGLEYNINNPNLEFFAELAPSIDLIPDTDVNIQGGIGLRYKF